MQGSNFKKLLSHIMGKGYKHIVYFFAGIVVLIPNLLLAIFPRTSFWQSFADRVVQVIF